MANGSLNNLQQIYKRFLALASIWNCTYYRILFSDPCCYNQVLLLKAYLIMERFAY